MGLMSDLFVILDNYVKHRLIKDDYFKVKYKMLCRIFHAMNYTNIAGPQNFDFFELYV